MLSSIDNQVIDFYEQLFDALFSEEFRAGIPDRLRRNTVVRQVEEAADAASQGLTRLFVNEQLTEQQTITILDALRVLPDLLRDDQIANPNVATETLAQEMLPRLQCPAEIEREGYDAVYGVALQ